ncbi:MAG TPA: hypothetical protein VFW96_12115 [Thermomicrobiales bacterium]|nr:hypothetical protein [Thermomicrobiales bacterium]
MDEPFIITDYKQYYLDTWVAMFREFLGWSEAETLRWAERWKEPDGVDPLDDTGDIFYHESPQYWAKHTLVPARLKETLSAGELIDLEARILDAFWDEHRFHFPPGTDWRPYREKVERILAEYGAVLPAAR